MESFVDLSLRNHSGQRPCDAYLIAQLEIIVRCLIAGNVNACDSNASDETCAYVCTALSEQRAAVEERENHAHRLLSAYDERMPFRDM